MRDLTTGNIRSNIWSMAIPLIASSFMQMAYNLTDMIWLGHLGSECVAAVGVAGFFTWLCNSLSFIGKVGGEVTISQSLGAHKNRLARIYANQATMLSFILAILYATFIFTTAPILVSLFHLESSISDMSVQYLQIVSFGIFFTFNNNTFSGVHNGQGNSKTPLKIVSLGLIANMILDPLLIYIFHLGTAGAAIATTVSQFLVFIIFVYKIYIKQSALGRLHFLVIPHKKFMLRVASLGLPVSLQSAIFAVIAMSLASLAATFGYVGVSVQSIGSQIEAITWMTGAGFSTALAAFVGQNYGAKQYAKIQEGYRYTMKLAMSISGVATLLFIFLGRHLFQIFVTDTPTLDAGRDYMFILAFSQIFSSLETVTTGAFNGCGRTIAPAINGIVLNLMRIPLAWILVKIPALGLNGIWLSITISSILKGVVLWSSYRVFRRSNYTTFRESKPYKMLGKMYAIASRLWQQSN